MLNLKIINGNTIKTVSNTFLIDLYKICTGKDSDSPDNINDFALSNESEIIGHVSVNSIYEHIYTYFRNKFNNFFITYDRFVIYFKCKVMEQLICNQYGTNGYITPQQAEAVTSLMSFQNNTNITSFDELSYFKNVHNINKSQFSGCTNLESIDLININGKLNSYAFQNCSKCNFKNAVNITAIEEYAFDGCSSLTSVDLSHLNNQTQLHTYTFRNCTSLETVILGQYINRLGNGSFQNCTNLTNINLSNVTILGGDSLKGCNSLPDNLDLSNIEQCNTVINIKNVVLPNCKSLIQGSFNTTNNTINGNRIETITILNAENLNVDWLFNGLINLKEIHINIKPGYNTKLGNFFCSGCSNLEVLDLGDNIKEIGNNAFGDNKIQELNLNKVEKIEGNMFYSNKHIIKLTAQYLNYIGPSTFDRCSNLRRINSDVDDTYDLTGITYIGQGCFAYSAAKNVILDPQITELPNNVFYSCTDLETINVNNIVTLNNTVFRSCKKISTFIFDKLETINGESFADTDFEYIKITNENQIVTINNVTTNVFRHGANTRAHKIFVPDSLYNDYLSDANWTTALSTGQATLLRLSEFNY